LGQRIRAARKRLGLSQPELASLLGVSQVTISQWERGQSRPSLDKLEPLAAKVGAGLEAVLGMPQEVREEPAPYVSGGVALPLLTLSSGPTHPPTLARVMVTEEEARAADAAFFMPDASMEPECRKGDLVGIKLAAAAGSGELILAQAAGEFVFRRLVGLQQGRVLLQALNPSYPPLAVERIRVLGSYRWLKRRRAESKQR
jgi:transcriptional regulator with XRE-family HTH domain